MGFNKKELENISNSLKFWNISEGQRECVNNLIEQIKELNKTKLGG